MSKKPGFLSAAVTLLVALVVGDAPCQQSAAVQAIATVLPTLSVIGTNDLDFEYVLPGVRKSVDKSSVGKAGEWIIHGSANAEISISFTLPDSLRNQTGPGAMRISFNSGDAAYDNGAGDGQTAPAGILNPHFTNSRNLSGNGDMVVWIGGTVYPTAGQPPGEYRAPIVLTVGYTGN